MPQLNTPRPAFQQMFLSVKDIERVTETLLKARLAFLRAGDTASAAQVSTIFATYNKGLDQLAVRTARFAETQVKLHFDRTAKRPERGTATPLRTLLVADTLAITPSIAYVGVGPIAVLDQAVNRNNSSREPYWRAQEFGFQYSHTPQGFFFTRGYAKSSLPDPSLFRVHPLFVPSKKGRKFMKPPTIEARNFLGDGSREAVRFWQAGLAALSASTIAEMDRLLAQRAGRQRAAAAEEKRRPGRRP